MENQTSMTEFNMLAFSTKNHSKFFVFSVFLLVYLAGILMNVTIITVICTNHHLHSPMYLFLCNLSFADICLTTTTVPNLLYMLLSGNNTVSFQRCFTQLYFFYLAISMEDILLVTMAYDRYVAICIPLHYHNILNRKMCTLLIKGMLVTGILNSLMITIPASNMVFCQSHIIRQFFCEAKAMAAIACSGVDVFYNCIYVEVFSFGILILIGLLLSYAKITGVIMGIKTKTGRKKAFITCSSHVTVLALYYGTASMPASKNSIIRDQIIAAMYAAVTPMLNPLIYSLQNTELKTAVWRLIRKHL